MRKRRAEAKAEATANAPKPATPCEIDIELIQRVLFDKKQKRKEQVKQNQRAKRARDALASNSAIKKMEIRKSDADQHAVQRASLTLSAKAVIRKANAVQHTVQATRFLNSSSNE